VTWFKVDDGLHSHRKAVRAGIPAMGLWVMAGSWCADNLTDGWLPDYIAMRLDRDYEENAKTLVQVGLWAEETRDGEPGWRFHEWNEPGRQPTKEQVLTDRAAAADRQKRARDRARGRREPGSRGDSQDDSRDSHAVTTAVTTAVTAPVTHAPVTGAVTVPPSRPVPSRPVPEVQNPSATAAAKQSALTGMPQPPPPPEREYTPEDLAFGVARWRIDERKKANAPIIGGGRNGALHTLKNILTPAFQAEYTEDEVRSALLAIADGIPSKQQLERELLRIRDPNHQGRAGAELARRPAPEQTRPSTSAARARQALAVAAQLDAKHANGATA
jgi:hypothetical protein